MLFLWKQVLLQPSYWYILVSTPFYVIVYYNFSNQKYIKELPLKKSEKVCKYNGVSKLMMVFVPFKNNNSDIFSATTVVTLWFYLFYSNFYHKKLELKLNTKGIMLLVCISLLKKGNKILFLNFVMKDTNFHTLQLDASLQQCTIFNIYYLFLI